MYKQRHVHVHWRSLLAKHQPYHDKILPSLLALATLGEVTQISHVYIGEGSTTMLATTTHDSDTLVLALATLGGATEIEMILSVSHHPR
jgi:hypothetical protein